MSDTLPFDGLSYAGRMQPDQQLSSKRDSGMKMFAATGLVTYPKAKGATNNWPWRANP